MSQAVRYERRGSIGIITVDDPPVNALSQAVRPEAGVERRRIGLLHWG